MTHGKMLSEKLDIKMRDENWFGDEINNKDGGHWPIGGK